MTEKHPKRPRDPNQLAKLITDIATGEAEDEPTPSQARGKRGGEVRATTLGPVRRREIASAAAKARWKGKAKAGAPE